MSSSLAQQLEYFLEYILQLLSMAAEDPAVLPFTPGLLYRHYDVTNYLLRH